jgi:hypothetical protein
MATGVQVVFDCADPDRLATFWAAALHYIEQPPPEGFASWEDWLRQAGIPEDQWNRASAVVDPDGNGPRIYFQRVPEPKTIKNRMHLDLNVSGPRGTAMEERRQRIGLEVERLTGLGARKLRDNEEYGEFCSVMADPEGNEFCVQ